MYEQYIKILFCGYTGKIKFHLVIRNIVECVFWYCILPYFNFSTLYIAFKIPTLMSILNVLTNLISRNTKLKYMQY